MAQVLTVSGLHILGVLKQDKLDTTFLKIC